MIDGDQADTAREVLVVHRCNGVCIRGSTDANEGLWWLGKGCDWMNPPRLRSGGHYVGAIGPQRQCDCAASDGDGGCVESTGRQLNTKGNIHGGHSNVGIKDIVDDGLFVPSLFNLVESKQEEDQSGKLAG